MIEIQYSDTALLLLVKPRVLHQNNGTVYPSLYQLLSEKITLHCQLCSTCYTAIQIKQLLKNNFCNQK